MNYQFVVILLVGISGLTVGAVPEIVSSVITKTDDCFQCGMIEGFGYLNVKVRSLNNTEIKF